MSKASSTPESNSLNASVLQVITTIDVGGAEHHLLSLCRGLLEQGCFVDVVFLKGNGTLAGRFRALGIEPIRIETERLFGYLRALAALFSLCRRQSYDIVHTHLLKANALGSVAARLAGVPVVIASKHNDEPQLLNPLIAWLHRILSRLDDRVLHSSEHIERYMIERGGVTAEKSAVVLYGLDGQAHRQSPPTDIRQARGISSDTVVVVCVARLIKRKGHDVLIEAFLNCTRATSAAMELWIVGDGPEADGLARLVADRGLTESVWFAGERHDVSSLLQEANVFVLASFQEGLGLVLLEAMAAGLPVVATKVGGMPELVEDGLTGRLVPASDVAALATVLQELAGSVELRERLGSGGRERQGQHFSHQRMMQDVVSIYRDLEREGSRSQDNEGCDLNGSRTGG